MIFLNITTVGSHQCPLSQALLKEVGEWRRHEESNNCLRRRFEESKQELEQVLQRAQSCLQETGDAEVLLRKHGVRQQQRCSHAREFSVYCCFSFVTQTLLFTRGHLFI